MATISPSYLGGGTLTTGAVAYVTASGSQTLIIKKAIFTNTDVAARTITVHRVPSGGAAAAGNMVIQAFSLSAGQTYDATALGNMVLTPGATLQALASTGSVVNLFVSGLSA
jgi:hypothetical protein